jgi:hypothetical protein
VVQLVTLDSSSTPILYSPHHFSFFALLATPVDFSINDFCAIGYVSTPEVGVIGMEANNNYRGG